MDNIEGDEFKVVSRKSSKKKESPEKQFNKKLKENSSMQDNIEGDEFKVVSRKSSKKKESPEKQFNKKLKENSSMQDNIEGDEFKVVSRKSSKKKESPEKQFNKKLKENSSMQLQDNTSTKTLNIEGDQYKVISLKSSKKKESPEKQFNKKLKENSSMQTKEVTALRLMYKEKFKVEDKLNRKYAVEFFIRGGEDASFEFSFPPEYPSDVPPTYKLNAPWLREKQRKDLYQSLTNIYTENFGKCIIYLWIDKITEVLKEEVNAIKLNPEEFEVEESKTLEPIPAPKVVENIPEIYEGTPIPDRGSCFSPYLAKVTSEEDVKKAIEKIEDCRKVSTAWRNTYAYRFVSEDNGKMVEFGEDGGEPKAGRNLLHRLVNYGAENVLVYISRRLGGSLLGPARFKHLNDAADDVLVTCGFKESSTLVQKDSGRKKDKKKDPTQINKKDKKPSKKKK